MEIRSALDKIIQRQDLSEHEMCATFTQIMSGGATDTQIGALLVAMRMKGETIDEISGAVNAMRSLSTKVEIDAENAVDIVGTGGDGANLFNISTVAAEKPHIGNTGVPFIKRTISFDLISFSIFCET